MTFDPNAITHIEIHSPDYAGKKLMAYRVAKVETGAGSLNAPIMPIPVQLLTTFGSPATLFRRDAGVYDPISGGLIPTESPDVKVMVYAEGYTIKECENIPGVLQGDTKVYVPGQSLGMITTALLLISCREEGS